ncbi:MAG: hypothetical protein ACHQUC_00130 [Chlamydiales bacterium]
MQNLSHPLKILLAHRVTLCVKSRWGIEVKIQKISTKIKRILIFSQPFYGDTEQIKCGEIGEIMIFLQFMNQLSILRQPTSERLTNK